MSRSLRVLVTLLLCVWLLPGAAADHVRVLLDCSQSMALPLRDGGGRNDPGRLAILATMLLFDLADLNTTLGDSFAVIPFDTDWSAWAADVPEPPRSRREVLRADSTARADLLRRLQEVRYESPKTYFYPVLARAVADLEPLPAGDGVRALVLVTDGVPEAESRERELSLIRALLPRLRAAGLRLYILAFGGDVVRHEGFIRGLVEDGEGSLGGVFLARDASALLDGMVQIFVRSFGYTADPPLPVAGLPGLDLEGDVSPQRALALVMTTARGVVPTLSLTAPGGATLNAPAGVRGAAVPGGAYALEQVLNPRPGRYRLATDARGGLATALRPTRLDLKVLPAAPGGETSRAMAGQPLKLRVRVSPASGARTDPGPVDLVFRVLGERTGAPGAAHAFEGKPSPPADNLGVAVDGGRDYEILVRFPENPKDPKAPYVGYLEVKVYRGEAVVGSLAGDLAQVLKVDPPGGYFRNRGGAARADFGVLAAGEQRCLPLPIEVEHYGEVPLELRASAGLPSEHWVSVRLPREELRLGEGAASSLPGDRFEVCLRVGRQAPSSRLDGEERVLLRVSGSREAEQSVAIRLTWEVRGLSFLERWWPYLLAGLALVGLAVLVAGFLVPARFQPNLALIFVEQQGELEEITPLPIKQWRGVGRRWGRPARAYLHGNYTVSGRSRGALAVLVAERGGARVLPVGPDLFLLTYAGDWETVGPGGRNARPGDTYRITNRGPFFRVAVRAGGR